MPQKCIGNLLLLLHRKPQINNFYCLLVNKNTVMFVQILDIYYPITF